MQHSINVVVRGELSVEHRDHDNDVTAGMLVAGHGAQVPGGDQDRARAQRRRQGESGLPGRLPGNDAHHYFREIKPLWIIMHLTKRVHIFTKKTLM